jgi:hypothetical protein
MIGTAPEKRDQSRGLRWGYGQSMSTHVFTSLSMYIKNPHGTGTSKPFSAEIVAWCNTPKKASTSLGQS